MADNSKPQLSEEERLGEWKLYHILRAFRDVIRRVEGPSKGKKFASAEEARISSQWKEYQLKDKEVGRQIRQYFVEYFQDRWTMRGTRSDCSDRESSVTALHLDAFFGLSSAMDTYEARVTNHESASPIAGIAHFGPSSPAARLPIEDQVQREDLTRYDDYYGYEDLIPPPPEPEDSHPSPVGSTGGRSDFSAGSDMMFSFEK